MSKLAHSNQDTMNAIERAARAIDETGPDGNDACPVCNGNGKDIPCAYPTERPTGCLRPREVAIVVNTRRATSDVYIGRGSIWGNPFRIGVHGTREEVIKLFEQWFRKSPELIKQLPKLKGKRLGCYCKPAACHGDVLVKIMKELKI